MFILRRPAGRLRPLLLLALSVTVNIVPSSSVITNFRGTLVSGSWVTSATPLTTLPAVSAIQCAILCARLSDCLAANWSPQGTCEAFTWEKSCAPGQPTAGAAPDGGLTMKLFPRCPRTCRELRDMPARVRPEDGVYQLGAPAETPPLFCDMSLDGGGWTLLVCSVSRDGWDLALVRERQPQTPSITDNYSILRHGDAVRAVGTGASFQYRLEGQAQSGRQQLGGIWSAPRDYQIETESMAQDQVTLLKRLGDWPSNTDGIENRIPWINTMGFASGNPLLTTTHDACCWWGTLITNPPYNNHGHSPWIKSQANGDSGTVLYWIREEDEPLWATPAETHGLVIRATIYICTFRR